MGKISLLELAGVLSKKYGLNKKEATEFVSKMFDIIQQSLEEDKVVKIKGLGTFKIIDVDARESVNVNTGERVLIEGHNKITFAPDPLMKELVNKPFSQFETVVLNEGVDFDDPAASEALAQETEAELEAAAAPLIEIVPEPEPEPEPESEEVEPEVIPLVDFGEQEEAVEEPEPVVELEPEKKEEEFDDEDIPEWVIEPIVPPTKPEQEPAPEPEPVVEPEPMPEPEPEIEPEPEPEPTPEPEPEPEPEADEEESEPEYEYEEEESSNGKKWLWALLALLLGLGGGYILGSYYPLSNLIPAQQEVVKPEEPVIAPIDTLEDVSQIDSVATVVEETEKSEAEEVKAEEPKKEEAAKSAEAAKPAAPKAEEKPAPKAEQPKPAAPKAEEKPAAKAEEKPAALDKYQQKDVRVRTGAWRIIGTAQTVKVKEGETLAQISRRYLGPDMECYVEVYNNLTASSPLKAGQEIKIPKLKNKKAK